MNAKFFPFKDILAELNLSHRDIAAYFGVNKNRIASFLDGSAELTGNQVLKTGQLMVLAFKTTLDPGLLQQQSKDERLLLNEKLIARQKELTTRMQQTNKRLAELKAINDTATLYWQKFKSMDLNSENLTAEQREWFVSMENYWYSQMQRAKLEKQYALNVTLQLAKQEFALNAKELAKK